jgi:hypothetical protein
VTKLLAQDTLRLRKSTCYTFLLRIFPILNSAEFSAMLESRVIFTLLLFAGGILTVQPGPVVAQNGYWQHRWASHYGRGPSQFRQEPLWRRWAPAPQTASHSTQRPTQGHGHFHEGSFAPKSIGLYNPGNTSSSQYSPNGGYQSTNVGDYRNPGYASQGASSSYQGGSSSHQSAGSSSRNNDSSGTTG